MGCSLNTTPWLLLIVFATCAVVTNAETSSEVQRLVQEIARKSSGISENTFAALIAVEKLTQETKNAAAKVDKILTTGEDIVNINLNVSNGVSQIRDNLDALDDLVATSRENNVTLKKLEAGLGGMTSLVDALSKNLNECRSENVRGLTELSTLLPQKLEAVVTEHCDVSRTAPNPINQTADNGASTSSVDSQVLEDLAEVVRDVSRDVAEFKSETGKTLRDLRASLEAVQRQVKQQADKKFTEATVHEALKVTPRKKVVWYAEGIREAIDATAKSGERSILSREFTISGYQARLRLQVNHTDGEAWLGAFFTLCPHPDDDFSQWPFVTPFTLSFLHPTDPSKDHNHDVLREELTGRFLSAVKKPKHQCSDRWIGFPKMSKADDMKKMGFNLDDGLSVAVHL